MILPQVVVAALIPRSDNPHEGKGRQLRGKGIIPMGV